MGSYRIPNYFKKYEKYLVILKIWALSGNRYQSLYKLADNLDSYYLFRVSCTNEAKYFVDKLIYFDFLDYSACNVHHSNRTAYKPTN